MGEREIERKGATRNLLSSPPQNTDAIVRAVHGIRIGLPVAFSARESGGSRECHTCAAATSRRRI